MTKIKYLQTKINHYCMHEDTMDRLNSGNSCYHLVLNLFSSHFLSKKTKIRALGYRNIIYILYRCETGSLTLQEEHRLRVFKNRVLRKIFGLKWEEVRWDWRTLHNEKLHDLNSSLNIIQAMKSSRIRWMGHVRYRGRRKMHIGFSWGNLKEREHLEGLGTDGRNIEINLK
jgi:hypothetical protein